eukprot:scaffold1025_cov102-Cylindrotheca_fusiformis.AAC.2
MDCRSSMDGRNNNKKRKSLEITEVGPAFFVYTRETKRADIPSETLTHLRVDSSVTEIPEEAFKDCKALVHVQLPTEALTRIGDAAFDRCSKLKYVEFVSRNDSLDASSINPNSLEDGTIVFPEGAKLQIDYYVFRFCRSLRKVIICSVSTTLGFAAFCCCNSLISVELPEGLQEIEQRLFFGCESLTTVKIPSSVIKIGSNAFSGCISLTSFDLPQGLMEIGEGSFRECDSIDILDVPATVSSIGQSAFEDCTGLKYVRLPPTLETIEMYVFKGCHGLEYINFPTPLLRIGAGAFSDCSSLSHIRIPPSVELIEDGALFACNSLISLEIPEIDLLFAFDLSHSDSLVNIAGPMLNVEIEFMNSFMQNSKLGSVVDGNDDVARYHDLARRLQHRFDGSPLNKLCYYQSYYSSEDAMMQLRSLMNENPLAATTEVDELGMTPLHTLSLSQTPKVEMLLALMKEGHLDHIMHSRDSFGSTPLDYLCLNRTPNAVQVIRRVLMTRFDQLLDLGRWWQSDILQAVDDALAVDFSFRRREIVAICLKLEKYEREEILSLVELCLWRIKIDEVGSEKEQKASRESCRINSGASIVIPHVLPFLAKLDVEDYFSRSI